MRGTSTKAAASIDEVFRLVDREVWIITSATDDGRRGGLVATWLSQASIERQRPVVVVGLAPNHFTAELVESSGGFVAHLIDASNIDIAWRFGLGSGRDIDKFIDVALLDSSSRWPILADALAWVECRVFAKYDAGDRWFFWADVNAGDKLREGQPLRERALFAAAADEQRARLAAGMQADIEALAGLSDRWRASLPTPPR